MIEHWFADGEAQGLIMSHTGKWVSAGDYADSAGFRNPKWRHKEGNALVEGLKHRSYEWVALSILYMMQVMICQGCIWELLNDESGWQAFTSEPNARNIGWRQAYSCKRSIQNATLISKESPPCYLQVSMTWILIVSFVFPLGCDSKNEVPQNVWAQKKGDQNRQFNPTTLPGLWQESDLLQ